MILIRERVLVPFLLARTCTYLSENLLVLYNLARSSVVTSPPPLQVLTSVTRSTGSFVCIVLVFRLDIARQR